MIADFAPKGYRNQYRDNGRHDGQLKGQLKTQSHFIRNRPAGPHRLAQIEHDKSAGEVPKLKQYRPVQTDIGMANVDILLIEERAGTGEADFAYVARNDTQ